VENTFGKKDPKEERGRIKPYWGKHYERKSNHLFSEIVGRPEGHI